MVISESQGFFPLTAHPRILPFSTFFRNGRQMRVPGVSTSPDRNNMRKRVGLFSDKSKRQGYSKSISSPKSKAEFLTALRDETTVGKMVVVIAEADGRGQLRIPGTEDTVRLDDLSQIGSLRNVYFLSCNSARIGVGDPALVFEGRVYTDDAVTFIEYLIPKGEPETRTKEHGDGKVQGRDGSVVVPVPRDDLGGAVINVVVREVACLLSEEDDDCSVNVAQIEGVKER